jgi:hypothetical protein
MRSYPGFTSSSRRVVGVLALLALVGVAGCRSDRPGESVVITGTVKDSGFGCWVLESGSDRYELLNLPERFQKAGLVATVQGKPRPDLASICMVGPIVEVLKVEEGAK